MLKKFVKYFSKVDTKAQIGRWRNVCKGCINTCPSDPGYYYITEIEEKNAENKKKEVSSFDIMDMTWNEPGM